MMMSALESYTVTQPRSMAQSQDKLCDPTLEKSHLHESQVTINCENGQLKETQYRGETANTENTHKERPASEIFNHSCIKHLNFPLKYI